MQFVSVDDAIPNQVGRSRAASVTMAVCAAALGLDFARGATAQVPVVLSGGPPVVVVPYVSEPGVPAFTITPGAANPFAGADGSGGGTSGGGTSGGGSTSGGGGGVVDGGTFGDGTGTDGTGGITTGGDSGTSDALNTMLGTSWGAEAAANATDLGLNPNALAATCVVESGCQNVGGPGTVAGAFQMTASTYTAMINAALAQDPSLASTIVPGLAGQMDPATESIAASEYLLQGAQYLQDQGISNPTVLDVRGYYNFGPQGGAQLANASPNQTMASVLTGYSAATLASNGITPGETVGQWQASVSAKIGNAALQSVLQS